MKNIRRLIIVMTFAVMAMIVMTGAAFAETKVVADGQEYEFVQADSSIGVFTFHYVLFNKEPTTFSFESDEFSEVRDWGVGENVSMPVQKENSVSVSNRSTFSSLVTELNIEEEDELYAFMQSTVQKFFFIIVKAPTPSAADIMSYEQLDDYSISVSFTGEGLDFTDSFKSGWFTGTLESTDGEAIPAKVSAEVIDATHIKYTYDVDKSYENKLGKEKGTAKLTVSYKGAIESKTFDVTLRASSYWSRYAEEPQKIAKGDKDWPEFVGYYKISTPEELAWFGKLVDGELEDVEQDVKAKAFLANDIVCNDTEGWEEWSNDTAGLRMFDCTIGKGGSENYNIPKIEFKGIFDGNGFAIKGLYIIPDATRENYQQINSIGFIACARDAEVKNLSVTESYARAANGSGFVGGIVGDMYTSTIENCSFIGAVDSGNFAGGILGGSEAGNTISQCFADCLMKSTGNVRGHVVGRGWNATVENCYSKSGGMVVAQVSNTWILNSYTTENVYIVPSSLSANNIVDCFSLAGTLEDTRVTQLTSEEFADGTLLEGLNSDAFCADDGNKNNGYPILVWQSDLYKAKKAAAKEVKYMLDPFDYSLNRKEFEEAVEMAVSAIMNAESEDAVAEAKASAIQALQAFESDASIVGKNEEAVNALKARLAELEAKIELQGAKVAVAEESVVADGKEKKPAVTVTGGSGAVLQEGTHYTVEYKDNVKPGIATVTVTGAGTAATESQETTFKILPKKLGAPKLKAAKKSLTVTWKKDPDVTGYQLQYSLKKNFKGAKTVKVTKAGTAKKVIKSLKSKKKYFVRVRSYKQVGKEVLNGAWSAAKNAKVK